MEIVLTLALAFIGYKIFQTYSKTKTAVDAMSKASLEECREHARSVLLVAAQQFADKGSLLAGLYVDTFKYASCIKARPEHIPTILCCMGAAWRNMEHASQLEAVYSPEERKKLHEVAIKTRYANLPANNRLVALLGRPVTEQESLEVSRFLDSMKWNAATTSFEVNDEDEA